MVVPNYHLHESPGKRQQYSEPTYIRNEAEIDNNNVRNENEIDNNIRDDEDE